MGCLEVFVCVFADDLITLNIDSSTTVQQLMSGILEADSSSHAIKNVTKRMNNYGDKNYILLCRGINLLEHPSSTLSEMGIKDHDHIYLSRGGVFHVHFKLFSMMSRSWPSIPVEAHEELIQLKEKISRMCSLPVSELDLYYCCQRMTDDHKPLAYYGIFIRRDMVDVDPPDSFHYEILAVGCSDRYGDRLPLFLQTFGSGSIDLPDSEIIVECTASIGTIRLRLAAKCSDTIDTLKSNICAKVPIVEGRSPLAYILEDLYMLIFNRKELENGSLTLDECGIKSGDKIQLCPKGSFYITVILVLGELTTFRNEVLSVDVRSSETVGTLKAKIRSRESIPSQKQILLRFKERWLADDQKCLLEYGIMELPLTHRYSDYYMRKTHNCIVEALTYG